MTGQGWRIRLAGGTLLALGVVSPLAWAAAAEPISLAQDGPWVANFDDDSCQLIGRFGTGKTSIVAIFTRYQPSDGFDLALQGASLEREGSSSQIKLVFGPGLPEQEALATLGTLGSKPLMMFNALRLDRWARSPKLRDEAPPAIYPEQEAAISTLTVRLGGKRNYRLELGSMGKPMATMRTCMDGLLKHWGYDPVAFAAQSRGAVPLSNPGTWVTSADYPSKALRGGYNGIIQFRLDLDETGKILGCHILARTNPDEFADAACRALTRRARFEPALDAAGKPTKTFYSDSIRFVIR